MRFILFVVLMPLLCFSHGYKPMANVHKIIYQSNLKRVYGSEPMIWYGLDFSRTRLLEPIRIAEKEIVSTIHFPAFLEWFKSRVPNKKIDRLFNGKTVTFSKDSFEQRQLKLNNKSNAVSTSLYEIDIDSIRQFVKSYKLKEPDGLGACMIVGNLIKAEEVAEAYFVFFDIKTRDPLYVCQTYGLANGISIDNHWSEGLYHCWGIYIDNYWHYHRVIHQALDKGQITETK